MAGSCALALQPRVALAAGRSDLLDAVDPFIGTGGHGHTYPGATTPFGMVQLSPDTSDKGWDSCSGYHQADGSIMGFSHTHLSGTGCADLLDVLLVPATGPVKLTAGEIGAADLGYRSRYDRATERARPGDYRVRLTDTRIDVELTATPRVGLHRYRFPVGEPGHVLIDFEHGQRDWWGNGGRTRIAHASLSLVGDDTVTGSRQVFQWAKGRWIHFALKLSRPFAGAELYGKGQRLDGAAQATGEDLKAVLRYPDAAAAPLIVKCAVSAVDVAGALANLRAEAPGFDFDGARSGAQAAWAQALGRIEIEGATPAQRTIFYTALYHSLLAPTLFSDADGRVRGMDGAIHTQPPGRAAYSTYSLWDTYRALHPLLTLVQPERTPDLVQDLVAMGRRSPAGPAVWPLQGEETGTMIGWHSAAVIAEAHGKGIQGVDYRQAWALYRKLAFESDAHGHDIYRRQGWIPCDLVDESASRTLEYAYDDWCMAALADAAGAHEDAGALRARSRNYRHLFDAGTGFMRPRLSDGAWATPFDPIDLGHDRKKWRDFTECNAWQATFLNQHDLYGYMAMFGGEARFEAKLDALFHASSTLPPDAPPDIAGLVGQYAHGNEPSHHVAYLYAYAGAHHKTQARVRMLCETFYAAAPDGLAGNEDCGQMSAWYVLSALGLYMVDPVSGVWVFGAPLFDRARLDLGRGRTLTLEAPGASSGRPFIRAASWNGRPHRQTWLSHGELARGGVLRFDMAAAPDPTYGADPADRPPSFGVVKAA